jgi:hypothetical protein
MAKKKELPGFSQKRKVLFGARTSPEKMREAGELFMEAGRHDDALEFFERCDAEDLIRQIATNALASGNTPLYMRAKRALGEEIAEAEWSELAAAAERAGAHTMAYVAHLKAGHEEEAARLRRLTTGAGEEEPQQGEDAEEAESQAAAGSQERGQ